MPQEFISAAKYGFLYQGQAFSWRQILRGTPTPGIPAEDFVCFIENHDQIANTGLGERSRFQTSRGCHRAMTALLLLGPWTPLLFQGQEFGASSPFLYFADVGDVAVRAATRRGRAQLLAPPAGYRWETLWTSDSPRYGGADAIVTATPEQWMLPGEAAVALRAILRPGNVERVCVV